MAEFQRKIELQSVDDLQYLIANIRRAAHEKINLDLPSVQDEDPMRKRVEEIVAQYINDVIELASPNISINGLGLAPARIRAMLESGSCSALEVEEYEPFDGRLFERAKDLARHEEDLIEEIAALRRTVPAKVVEDAKIAFRSEIESDEAMIRELEDRIEAVESRPAALGISALERQAELEKTWDKSLQKLESLMRSLPEMIAKKQRAQEAEAFVLKEEER